MTIDTLAVSFALIALFAFSLYGWGRTFRRLFHMERGTWPATAAVGMALVVFLGGILNLARLAYPSALAIVAVAGILLAIPGRKEIFPARRFSHHLMAFLLAVLIAGFVVRTQLPPKAYNFHDDYQKYFAHAVRMIETGTVYGSPLSAMGSETLGAQAFLQGFIVAFFPISYINGFDAVFAMFLCLMLASEFTGGRPGLLVTEAICIFSVVVINPQYVNVSTLYAGSALVMALAAIVSNPRELQKKISAPESAAIGLLCAALIALKPTFALFVLILLLLLAVGLGARWSVRTALFFVAFLSPWLLLHAPHYLAALHVSPSVPTGSGVGVNARLNFFSFDALPYGSSIASYTLLIAAIGVSALMVLWAAGKQDGLEGLPVRLLAVFCAAGMATYFILLWGGISEFGPPLAIRYYVPLAVGLAPAAFGSSARHMSASGRFRSPPGVTPRVILPIVPPIGLPIGVAVLALLAFLPSLRERVVQARNSGSVLAFSWLADDPEYLAYNQKVLHGSTREKVAAAQGMIPAGATVIAWINTPFYLDYARNRIIDAEPAGLSTGWAVIPPARYFIWEYGGYATRSEADLIEQTRLDVTIDRRHAARTLEFMHRARAWAEQGQTLYDDGERKVVLLPN